MAGLTLHHVSVPVRDLARSARFYDDVLGLERITRPPFPFPGVWYGLGAGQLHLIVNPEATYRPARIDPGDVHFALATRAFEAWVDRLAGFGYRADLSPDDPKWVRIGRGATAGFDQVFLLDPDNHVIEINSAEI